MLRRLTATTAIILTLAAGTGFASGGYGKQIANVAIGTDNNSAANAFIQPANPALSGNGIDQSLQFGDVLVGTKQDDLQIGLLGVDVLIGSKGGDVLIGGPEHFNPQNRDRAFGNGGSDIFIWAPGDGSDFFDGGKGKDIIIFGLLGEVVDGALAFRVSNDQQAGEVWLDPTSKLPAVDVTNSPGFCRVLDRSSGASAAASLDALDLDHLVQFFVRGPANSFENGQQATDNGLRVTLHLRDVEILVCTNRQGGVLEVFDLTVSPAQPIPFDALPARVKAIVR